MKTYVCEQIQVVKHRLGDADEKNVQGDDANCLWYLLQAQSILSYLIQELSTSALPNKDGRTGRE
jgi:hypothetical protein